MGVEGMERSGKQERIVQLSFRGIVILSACLVVSSALITFGLVAHGKAKPPPPNQLDAPTSSRTTTNGLGGEIGPWGELVDSDIEIEQPDEYADFEAKSHPEAIWSFDGLSATQVGKLLMDCGLPPTETVRVVSKDIVSESSAGTRLKPDDDLLLSISPDVRAKLYPTLARFRANIMMRFPWTFPGQTFESRFDTNELSRSTIDVVRRSLYEHNGIRCFSDYELAMRRASSDEERFHLVKALSRQSAVLPRLRIRPDTDIGKLVNYWGRGAQAKDLHPLFDSLKRLQGGGSISILYMMPPFARERLCTFPTPSHPGDPALDCNWSALNFFNDPPDDRFTNPAYLVSFVSTNFYQISKPTMYGDLILFLDENTEIAHSAVYIADDLAFTKNGNSFVQPWKLMRMKDLANVYALATPTQILYYRNKKL